MPHLLITADTDSSEMLVFSEELTPMLLADGHCRDQLFERLVWALDDASEAEVADPPHAASTFAQRRSR
jgi:hypothetical protein